jgi:hypothetical protein
MSRGRFPTPNPSEPRYTEDELKGTKISELKRICETLGIENIPDSRTKKPYIDLILGKNTGLDTMSEMEESSEMSASLSHPGKSLRFTQTLTAKGPPSSGRSAGASAAKGEPIEAHVFASLTAGSIAEMPAPVANALRKRQWTARYKTGDQPWDNLDYLIRAVLTRMMPENPEYVGNPVLVVNNGAAGVGKSNGPFSLGLSCNQTLVLNPDEWYEFFAIMFGYFPPNEDSPWWEENRGNFGPYETVIPSEHITRDTTRPVASEFCSPKVHCLSAYPKMLHKVKDFIFEQALDKSSESNPRRLNIVFDSTGLMEGVIDEYIETAKRLGYRIVIVGVYSTLKNCIGRVDQDALGKWRFGSEEESADKWRPMRDKQIERPDIPPEAGGGAAAGAVSCRNKQQHRKLDAGGLRQVWESILDKVVIFKWVDKAKAQGWRIVLVENNLSSANKSGGVGIIYDSGSEPTFVQKPVDGRPETVSALFRPTGFYGMKLGEDGSFYGREQVEGEAAAKAAAKSGRGGSSRKRIITRGKRQHYKYRKTIKKYTRPVTRRRRHRRHI